MHEVLGCLAGKCHCLVPNCGEAGDEFGALGLGDLDVISGATYSSYAVIGNIRVALSEVE